MATPPGRRAVGLKLAPPTGFQPYRPRVLRVVFAKTNGEQVGHTLVEQAGLVLLGRVPHRHHLLLLLLTAPRA